MSDRETPRDTIAFLTAARAHMVGQPWPPDWDADPLKCVGIIESLGAYKRGSTNFMKQWDVLIKALPPAFRFETRYDLQQLDAFERNPATTKADVLALFPVRLSWGGVMIYCLACGLRISTNAYESPKPGECQC